MLRKMLAGLGRRTSPEEEAPPPPAATGGPPAATILLVDDDPILRSFLKVSLEGQGYRVVDAGNGREGIEAARRERPDLIVLDGSMPEMDGFEALKGLRRERRTARTPVIMLTMRVREGDVLTGFRYGAQEYLTKPVAIEELIGAVKEQLRKAR